MQSHFTYNQMRIFIGVILSKVAGYSLTISMLKNTFFVPLHPSFATKSKPVTRIATLSVGQYIAMNARKG